MEALKRFFYKLTPTKALETCSGQYEMLFFESVYRVTYITGFSLSEKGLPYFLYGSIIKLIFFLLTCGELCYVCTENTTMDEKVSWVNSNLLIIVSFYRYKNMKIDNKAAYQKLAASMESPHFDTTTPERKLLVRYYANKNEQYLKLIIGLGNLTLLAWFTYPLVDSLEYNLILGTSFPFDYKTPTLYPIAYVSVVIAFICVAHFVMVLDVTMQAHLIHLICQLLVLGDCFENLLRDCQVGFEGTHPNYLINNKEFANKYTQRLGNLVKQHQLILSHIMNLRNSLSRPMFFQFFASGILICFIGYETIMTLTLSWAKTLNSLLFLGYNVFELYIICLWCDEIRVQCQNIGESIYCCGWESGVSTEPGVKQTVKLVIARANKPLVITAGGMYELSLASFSNLVKTSYSALTVVLRLAQHK